MELEERVQRYAKSKIVLANILKSLGIKIKNLKDLYWLYVLFWNI